VQFLPRLGRLYFCYYYICTCDHECFNAQISGTTVEQLAFSCDFFQVFWDGDSYRSCCVDLQKMINDAPHKLLPVLVSSTTRLWTCSPFFPSTPRRTNGGFSRGNNNGARLFQANSHFLVQTLTAYDWHPVLVKTNATALLPALAARGRALSPRSPKCPRFCQRKKSSERQVAHEQDGALTKEMLATSSALTISAEQAVL